MGLLDSLKKATGLGLDAQATYDRAYEKAVLLGQNAYHQAPPIFAQAAQKAQQEGKHELAIRAQTNAALYTFITKGDLQSLQSLAELLGNLPEIERIGYRSEVMSTGTLLGEVQARLIEARILSSQDTSTKAHGHDQAAQAFKAIFNEALITYAFQSPDRHRETAHARFFLHTGLASWHRALDVTHHSPQKGVEHMSRALGSFKNAKDEHWTTQAESWLSQCRISRTCWMCHREFQGNGLYFRFVSAELTPYIATRLQELNQDSATIDLQQDHLVLCTPCFTTVENMATAIAEEKAQQLRRELHEALEERDAALRALEQRLRRLEQNPLVKR